MRLLIAEDDAHLRDGLAELLRLEGFECLVAADGAAALAAFRAQRPDFCILDVAMPGLDGIEVCRAIREENAAVPILLLTARGEEIDRVLGLESGADDYVVKPFGARELVARIRAIARRSARGNEARGEARRFRMGDLEIDCQALRAFRAGAAIDLTPREVALLALLHTRAGLAVGRDELLDAGWGRDYLPSSRALDQAVSVLRRKIERDPAAPRIIRAVHGVGYRYDG